MLTSPLTEWLKSQGLERYSDLFEKNEVDLPTLRLLTDEDLEELGLPFGPRKRILNLLGEERRLENHSPPDAAVGQPAGERRQLTVLFCDMVDFTRLAHRLDPETLQVVVRAYESACATCVRRYDGYLFATLGDGVVAFFGYPLAHEGEAERAIRAGLDIVEAMTALDIPNVGRLQVRIGVAAGIVVVSPGGRQAVGEAMNLAARLQTIARPGMVVVSRRVRRLAEGLFHYEDMGERKLKGVSKPTRVYRVAGIREAESRFDAAAQRGLTPFVGREKEVGALVEAWHEAHAGGPGRVVTVTGEAGVGKSRVIDALRRRLSGEIGRTFLFQGSPFFANSAFYPIRAWLERTLNFRHDEDVGSRLDKLEAFVHRELGLANNDLRLIAAMLSVPFQDRYGAVRISPKLAREDTMRSLIDIVQAQARSAPTLIVYEDVHWADPSTMDFFTRLVDRISHLPALVVITARPEFKPPWTLRPEARHMPLPKFTPAESRSLLAGIVGDKSLPAELAAQIIERTDGVPLYVEELTKTILETAELIVEGDRLAYAGSAAAVSIPETLRGSLMARLDRVPTAREVAQVGSVVGREFKYELIAGLEIMSEDSLALALRMLTTSALLNCQGEIPHSAYAFSHALLQDAAYDSILKSRRKQLHADVARVLSERWPETERTAPELLAYHYTIAEQHQLAGPLWLRAGEAATQRFALAEG